MRDLDLGGNVRVRSTSYYMSHTANDVQLISLRLHVEGPASRFALDTCSCGVAHALERTIGAFSRNRGMSGYRASLDLPSRGLTTSLSRTPFRLTCLYGRLNGGATDHPFVPRARFSRSMVLSAYQEGKDVQRI